MAELENLMRQLYDSNNRSTQGTYRAMDLIFKQANKKSKVAEGMITAELGLAKDSYDAGNLSSATSNIASIISENQDDSLIVGYGEAAIKEIQERSELIDHSAEVRKTTENLLNQSNNLKNLKPEDREQFSQGIKNFENTIFSKRQTSDVETESRDALKLLKQRDSNVKLRGVLEATDADSRNTFQNLSATHYLGMYDAVPEEYKKTIGVRGIENLLGHSDEKYQMDMSRDLTTRRLRGAEGFNPYEAEIRSLELNFRSLGDEINYTGSYLKKKPYVSLFREGRFDEDSIASPALLKDMEYQLARFLDTATPDILKTDDEFKKRWDGKDVMVDLQEYKYDYIKDLFGLAQSSMRAKDGNIWEDYYGEFESSISIGKKGSKPLSKAGKQTSEDPFYKGLYNQYADAFDLLNEIRALRLEAESAGSTQVKGSEDEIGAPGSYANPALPW